MGGKKKSKTALASGDAVAAYQEYVGTFLGDAPGDTESRIIAARLVQAAAVLAPSGGACYLAAKVQLMMAFEVMEKIRDDESGSMPRKEVEDMLLGPMKDALHSAIVGADKYKSALCATLFAALRSALGNSVELPDLLNSVTWRDPAEDLLCPDDFGGEIEVAAGGNVEDRGALASKHRMVSLAAIMGQAVGMATQSSDACQHDWQLFDDTLRGDVRTALLHPGALRHQLQKAARGTSAAAEAHRWPKGQANAESGAVQQPQEQQNSTYLRSRMVEVGSAQVYQDLLGWTSVQRDALAGRLHEKGHSFKTPGQLREYLDLVQKTGSWVLHRDVLTDDLHSDGIELQRLYRKAVVHPQGPATGDTEAQNRQMVRPAVLKLGLDCVQRLLSKSLVEGRAGVLSPAKPPEIRQLRSIMALSPGQAADDAYTCARLRFKTIELSFPEPKLLGPRLELMGTSPQVDSPLQLYCQEFKRLTVNVDLEHDLLQLPLRTVASYDTAGDAHLLNEYEIRSELRSSTSWPLRGVLLVELARRLAAGRDLAADEQLQEIVELMLQVPSKEKDIQLGKFLVQDVVKALPREAVAVSEHMTHLQKLQSVNDSKSDAELFGDVLLAYDMLASDGLLSVGLSEAIVAEILQYHYGKQGSAEYYQKPNLLSDWLKLPRDVADVLPVAARNGSRPLLRSLLWELQSALGSRVHRLPWLHDLMLAQHQERSRGRLHVDKVKLTLSRPAAAQSLLLPQALCQGKEYGSDADAAISELLGSFKSAVEAHARKTEAEQDGEVLKHKRAQRAGRAASDINDAEDVEESPSVDIGHRLVKASLLAEKEELAVKLLKDTEEVLEHLTEHLMELWPMDKAGPKEVILDLALRLAGQNQLLEGSFDAVLQFKLFQSRCAAFHGKRISSMEAFIKENKRSLERAKVQMRRGVQSSKEPRQRHIALGQKMLSAWQMCNVSAASDTVQLQRQADDDGRGCQGAQSSSTYLTLAAVRELQPLLTQAVDRAIAARTEMEVQTCMRLVRDTIDAAKAIWERLYWDLCNARSGISLHLDAAQTRIAEAIGHARVASVCNEAPWLQQVAVAAMHSKLIKAAASAAAKRDVASMQTTLAELDQESVSDIVTPEKGLEEMASPEAEAEGALPAAMEAPVLAAAGSSAGQVYEAVSASWRASKSGASAAGTTATGRGRRSAQEGASPTAQQQQQLLAVQSIPRHGSPSAVSVDGGYVLPPKRGTGQIKGGHHFKLDNDLQKEWQSVRSTKGLHRLGFGNGPLEPQVIEGLRMTPPLAARRALARLRVTTFQADEDICARILATLREECEVESGSEGAGALRQADADGPGRGSSTAATAECTAAQQVVLGAGHWSELQAVFSADSAGADGWQSVQGKGSRWKGKDARQARGRTDCQQRLLPEHVRSKNSGSTDGSAPRILTVPRSVLPPAKNLRGDPQPQPEKGALQETAAALRQAGPPPFESQSQPALPLQQLPLHRLTPEMDARWQTLQQLAHFSPEQARQGSGCLASTVPGIAVRVMDGLIGHLKSSDVQKPSIYALRALTDALHYQKADAIEPSVEALAQQLCAVVGIPREGLDPRVDHILATNSRSFGHQVLESLLHKEWSSTRSPNSYIANTLAVHAKTAANIGALPQASLQPPPSLQDRLQRLYAVAEVEAWQMDPSCIVALLEMPLQVAESRLEELMVKLGRMVKRGKTTCKYPPAMIASSLLNSVTSQQQTCLRCGGLGHSAVACAVSMQAGPAAPAGSQRGASVLPSVSADAGRGPSAPLRDEHGFIKGKPAKPYLRADFPALAPRPGAALLAPPPAPTRSAWPRVPAGPTQQEVQQEPQVTQGPIPAGARQVKEQKPAQQAPQAPCSTEAWIHSPRTAADAPFIAESTRASSATAAIAAHALPSDDDDEFSDLLSNLNVMVPSHPEVPLHAACEAMPAQDVPVARAWGLLPPEQQEDVRQYQLLGSSINGAEYPTPGQQPAASEDRQYDISLEEQEDAELQSALLASLEETVRPVGLVRERQALGAGPQLPIAGLQNETGEYNCFLNVIIQCLWHCRDFRRRLLDLGAELVQDEVVAALLGLFRALQEQEVGALPQEPAPGSVPHLRRVVTPSALREALSALPGQGFQMGEMNDASEVLYTLYESINASAGAASPVDAIFGLSVREGVFCHCGKDTHKQEYCQYFYNAAAAALRMLASQAEVLQEPASLGALLRSMDQQHLKACDLDQGGCGDQNLTQHFLEGASPAVFTMQLVWESQHQSSEVIAESLAALQETIDLGELFLGVPTGTERYKLRSMVCFYGAHYQALLLLPVTERWTLVDDASVSDVGSWAAVCRKCQLGRIQPSMLFFEKI